MARGAAESEAGLSPGSLGYRTAEGNSLERLRAELHVSPGGEPTGDAVVECDGEITRTHFFGLRLAHEAPAGEPIAWFRDERGRFPLLERRGDGLWSAIDFFAWEGELLDEAWWPRHQPRYSRLPVPYRLIPFRVRAALVRGVRLLRESRFGRPVFPAWPVDTTLDRLRAALVRASGPAPLSPGPPRVVLTHDIDTEAGVAGIEPLRRIEREFDAPSAFGVVATAYDLGVRARVLVDEGCELFCHGWNHDGRLAWLEPDGIASRLDAAIAASPSGVGYRGFRSPQLVRTPELYAEVAKRFDYDLTPPTVELWGPHGPATGCATVLPFRDHFALTHLPVTLPQDFYLAYVLGLDRRRLAACWVEVADRVAGVGGVSVVIVHPDNVVRTPWLLGAYRDFLTAMRSRGADFLTPGQVLGELG